MQAISLWLAAAIVILTGWAIVKKYQVNMVLFIAGLLLNIIGVMNGATNFLPKNATATGLLGFDFFELFRGIGRVQETMEGVNDAFKKAHIPLPLPTATTVTDKNRREAGEQMVMKLNGDRMKQILSQVAKDEYDLRVNDLYDFCFGDFYTRSGLSLKDRELVVFGAIAALGGCEAQLRSHIGANLREGTTKAQLVDALRVMLPYLGFPRTLNAMNQVTQLTKDSK